MCFIEEEVDVFAVESELGFGVVDVKVKVFYVWVFSRFSGEKKSCFYLELIFLFRFGFWSIELFFEKFFIVRMEVLEVVYLGKVGVVVVGSFEFRLSGCSRRAGRGDEI